ncbi:Precorrin-3B C17-methyltransferase / Precorrin-6X reductase [Candidatus Glomeribacter gigasporarum BEG34]|uniref:Precorrin-3B C17-methyltransferase / Precorrin-6X reductase n=1 Tax=Candidatus Glomeribacter gigasporarum BEG34 TaxID=1070319 RepID=G2JAL0_9BURK|nr:precorrin-3B C(17)-methyltransferase [Candidatus Glomeribacter gigasporarum]CCD29812.1 Precorrin-3B C17-methyltransferase / Precorrin-6X reductase [Candidatus Glomeribacter gigasporarum BEG34]
MTTGLLNLVSVGPGHCELIAPQAADALRNSDIIVGYSLYLRWVAPWIKGKHIHTLPLTQERTRADVALASARAGQRVALVSSGDIGVYAMAALLFEQMDEADTFDLRITPGITAANACASLLGSPLSHDFATLSLSDWLCPWQWIEHRARHIAQADLAVALYNVQSKRRLDGIYKILRIMLEHKRADTWCGAVRNAYRQDQQVDIMPLGELPKRQFDMLTTIVIGNRFTQRKRQWIYTPRGYSDWDEKRTLEDAAGDAVISTAPANARLLVNQPVSVPVNAVWVFSGTSDGNALARLLVAAGLPTVVSVASAYGMELVRRNVPGATVVAGRLGIERRRQLLKDSRARLLIDATHPYSLEISHQLIELSRELDLDYFRYERPDSHADAPTQQYDSVEAAAQAAIASGRRIFLAMGVNYLASFIQHPDAADRAWYLRLTPDPVKLQRALELGMQRDRLIAMQGPFSQTLNEALWRDLRIDCIVSKASGDAGGYPAKARAAHALGIPFITIRRPAIVYPRVAENFAAILSFLQATSSA